MLMLGGRRNNHRPQSAHGGCFAIILGSTIFSLSCLIHLDYQSTHQGELIGAWHVGSKNTYYVMEQFQYFDGKNQTCLIRRNTKRTKKKTKTAARQKKIGTRRKIWLYREGRCTDSGFRSYSRIVGSLWLLPLAGFFCFLLVHFGICFPDKRIEPVVDAPNTPMPVPQSEPPNDDHVTSNEGQVETEVEVEMFENDKYQEEDAPPPV